MKTVTVSINGGKPLSGAVVIASNKNAVLPALAASLLTKQVMTYENIPQSPDVIKICAALTAMGAEVENPTEGTISICCKNVTDGAVPREHINEMQAGYLFAGPLLARFGKAIIPQSSGCRLGYRGHEDHAQYFSKLDVSFLQKNDSIEFTLNDSINDNRLNVVGPMNTPKRYTMYNSAFVTPTENILMLLAGTSRYATEISGIAQEPHVVQLISLLRKMGANIKGKGSTITVTGVDKLIGAHFVPEPDHVDYFGFAITAAMTKSDILLKVPIPLAPSIAHMNEFLEQTGVKFELEAEGVRIYGSKSSYTPSDTFPRASEDTFKMNPGPWPMFPVDCLPSFIAWSTLNPDPLTSTRSQNWLYTDGLKYVPVMKEMGARISLNDDQRVIALGTSLGNPYNATLDITAPDVIEGARAIISCALSGGNYDVKNAQYILRRNPNFFTILKELGADITVL